MDFHDPSRQLVPIKVLAEKTLFNHMNTIAMEEVQRDIFHTQETSAARSIHSLESQSQTISQHSKLIRHHFIAHPEIRSQMILLHSRTVLLKRLLYPAY